jgi:hypothetical protein
MALQAYGWARREWWRSLVALIRRRLFRMAEPGQGRRAQGHPPPARCRELDLWIKTPPEFGAAGVQDLRLASYLDASDTPGAHRGDVVDDEGHLGVPEDVPVLLALGEMVATDVDGVVLLVVAETRRHHMRHCVWTNGRQTPQADTGCQVFTLFVGEDAHKEPPFESFSGGRATGG